MTLDQCKAYAQRKADSQGQALVILNLNKFNPLYVVRQYDARFDGVVVDGVTTLPRDLVCVVRPQPIVEA